MAVKAGREGSFGRTALSSEFRVWELLIHQRTGLQDGIPKMLVSQVGLVGQSRLQDFRKPGMGKKHLRKGSARLEFSWSRHVSKGRVQITHDLRCPRGLSAKCSTHRCPECPSSTSTPGTGSPSAESNSLALGCHGSSRMLALTIHES